MGYFSMSPKLDPAANKRVVINDQGSLGSDPNLAFEKAKERLELKHMRAKGMLITGQNVPPAAADLANGEVAFWFNPQAASLGYIAKNLSGEIISGTIQATVIL